MDFLFPESLNVASARWDLVSNASFFRTLSGSIRTYSRTGDYWKASLTLPPGTSAQAAFMRVLSAQLRGGVNGLWVYDHSYTQRGSFPASELLSNTTFVGTTSWTVYTSATDLTASENILRATANNTTQYIGAYQNATVTSGAAYVGRAILHSGDMANFQNSGVNLWNTVTPGLVIQSLTTDYGYKSVGAVAPSNGLRLEVVASSAGTSPSVNHAVGEFVNIGYASMSRCIMVNGASQTGSGLDVDALPTSTAGLLLPGDRVQIGSQLVVVTEPLNSNGSGQGRLQFEPPLRSSPANDSAVVVHHPMCRMMLSNAEAGFEVIPGAISTMSLELVEDVR